MSDFSLELNEDQLQIQKWVHDFAADVMRPAAPEWDEREETPWPIIEEAAKIGLYSWEFIANAFGDPTGLTFPIVSEELCWGDAGITLAMLGTTPRCVGHRRQRHARADRRVGAAVLRHRRRHSHGRVRGERTRRRFRRVVAAHARRVRRSEGRVGASTARRRGSRTAASRRCRTIHVVVAAVDPELKSRGHASFIVPAGHAGPHDGPEVQEDGHPRVAHCGSRARRRARARQLPARRQGEARRAARACA